MEYAVIMKQKLNFSSYLVIGSMLFGLFFGAGNLIFPVHMGQEAGSNLLPAVIGFIITSTGLPFLGTIAIGISDSGSLMGLASRVSKFWAYLFTLLLYLTIGPLFALPRTATVSYEVGFTLFIPQEHARLSLLIFTLAFFGAALFFSLYPQKLLLWIGKVLNPTFLVLIGILLIACVLAPMGSVSGAPVAEAYASNAFFKGFTEGYNTMDALASLAFGVLIVDAIKNFGVKDQKEITIHMAKTGAVCASLMVIIYAFLSYMGTASLGQFALSPNGGIALAQIAGHYFGFFGNILLALLVTVACIKTAIGLITSCADVFVELFPNSLSYRRYVVIFTLVSMLIANVGLTQIIQFSIPILMFLYPQAIVLILLTMFSGRFGFGSLVYKTSIFTAAVFSFGDAIAAFPPYLAKMAVFEKLLAVYRLAPFFDIGMSWVIPSLIGLGAGILLSGLSGKKNAAL